MDLEPKILELLKKRGIEGDEIGEYISPRPQKTHDPFLLHNLGEGVDLILSAIKANKKICVYGDYDADGITSTVIMMDVLSELTKNIIYYVPSRFDEGYGLNMDAVSELKKQGVDLLVTVDCGSVSVEEVRHAKDLGMEVLVTDHHKVTDVKADCLIINPNQPECDYPCPHIAGCGVAFKVCQAVVDAVGLEKTVLYRNLDMLGIGTIGDIVPLVDENRTFAKYGIRAINAGMRRNLRMLIEAIGLRKGEVTAENVSFGIVPRLNAAGRLQHAKLAIEMFLEEDESEAKKKIEELCRLNDERKLKQEAIYEHCINTIESRYADSNIFLLYLSDAHEGVTGIVAGKIKEKYNRPAILLTDTHDGCLKGTGRSMEGIDLFKLLKENEELFLKFGGHAAACGFTMQKENAGILRANLEELMGKILDENPSLLDKKTEAEIVLEPDEVSMDFVRQLDLLEPCGCMNEKPLMAVCGRAEKLRRIGNRNRYLQFVQKLRNGRILNCTSFNDPDAVEKAIDENPDRVVIGRLSINSWKGYESIRMTVEAIGTE